MRINADHLLDAGRLSAGRFCPDARDVHSAVARLAREFGEMPRLQLRIDQAARLTGADPATAEDALRALVASGVLVEGPNGAFLRAEPALRFS